MAKERTKARVGFTLLLMAFASLLLIGPFAGVANATGTGEIDFYLTDSGSATVDGSCTSSAHGTVWPTYGMDGAVGFPTNLPGGSNTQVTPTAPVGTSYICVHLTMSGQSSTVDSYSIWASGSTITSGTATCTTTSTGSGAVDCWFILTLTVTSGCVTNPIKVSPTVAGAGDGGSQLQHIANLYYNNGTCTPPTSAPEFPLGLLGVFALALPALLVLRKRAFTLRSN